MHRVRIGKVTYRMFAEVNEMQKEIELDGTLVLASET